jgi:hypothetical protein
MATKVCELNFLSVEVSILQKIVLKLCHGKKFWVSLQVQLSCVIIWTDSLAKDISIFEFSVIYKMARFLS